MARLAHGARTGGARAPAGGGAPDAARPLGRLRAGQPRLDRADRARAGGGGAGGGAAGGPTPGTTIRARLAAARRALVAGDASEDGRAGSQRFDADAVGGATAPSGGSGHPRAMSCRRGTRGGGQPGGGGAP